MTKAYAYRLLEVFGIEIEYMIVDQETLMPVPLASVLLTNDNGVIVSSLQKGRITISNELAAHVIELKAEPPTADLTQLAHDFQRAVKALNAQLAAQNAMLAPGGIHPWMNPAKEGALWTHDGADIYAWYDKTFNCRRHGWLNLQSCHLNLPFATETEFAALHDAIILVLPLLPALAASSPYCEGRYEGWVDFRIHVYAHNQARFPEITGPLIPETIHDEETYRREIHAPAYAAVKPYDTEGIVEPDWLNSRGAIARFDRGAIEIRLLDAQEYPAADVAICALVIDLLKRILAIDPAERSALVAQYTPHERREHLFAAAREGQSARIFQPQLAEALGLEASAMTTLGQFWKAVYQTNQNTYPPIEYILEKGCLGQRQIDRLGTQPELSDLQTMLRELTQCLQDGRPYKA